jgi:hypothetical protein
LALLKLYVYGYLNRVQSSRRLERESGRNVELMWLLGRLVPDLKTVADLRKDNGHAIRKVCARFVELCREMGLLATASVAIDGSKFKAVNNRDRNVTRAKVERRRAQLEESVARYLSQLETADRHELTKTLAMKVGGQGDDEPLIAQKNALDRRIVERDAAEATSMRPSLSAAICSRGRHFEQDQLDLRTGCAITANDFRQFGVES